MQEVTGLRSPSILLFFSAHSSTVWSNWRKAIRADPTAREPVWYQRPIRTPSKTAHWFTIFRVDVESLQGAQYQPAAAYAMENWYTALMKAKSQNDKKRYPTTIQICADDRDKCRALPMPETSPMDIS